MKNIKRLIVLFVLIVFTVAAILWLNSSNDKKDASKEVIGSGDQSKLFPRSPRLSFDEACRII
jgi:hypothetical protein